MKEPKLPENPEWSLDEPPEKPQFRQLYFNIITEKEAKRNGFNSRILMSGCNDYDDYDDYNDCYDYEAEINIGQILEVLKREGISPKDVEIDFGYDHESIIIKDKAWIKERKRQIMEKYHKDLAEYNNKLNPEMAEYKKQLNRYAIERAEYDLWKAKAAYNKATKAAS